MKNLKFLKIIGLVLLASLLVVNCAEEGEKPQANVPPTAFITGYQMSVAPGSGYNYPVTVYWGANDPDGYIIQYRWRIFDGEGDSIWAGTNNLSRWQTISDVNTTVNLDFPNLGQSYLFHVSAQDNIREWSATPAEITITRTGVVGFNYPPNTIIEEPPNGALTGPGIRVVVRGEDIDGVMDTIEYQVDDDTSWTKAAANVIAGSGVVLVRGLSGGAHTIKFRAHDNFGAVDPSPASVSVVVDTTLAPELAISVRAGDKYVVPYTNPELEELIVTLNATVDFYYSFIDSFRISSSTGASIRYINLIDTFYVIAGSETLNVAAGTVPLTNVEVGEQWIEVIAYDIGGNSTTTDTVDFEVIEVPAGDGVLCVNGIDWATYGSQAVNIWNNGVPWGNRTHYKWWDLFVVPPGGGRPHPDSLLGFGTPPEWLFDTLFFDAVIWFGNNYSGDLAYWEDLEPTILAYLNSGGNVLLATRMGSSFFGDDLSAYAHVSSWTTGANPTSLVAIADSLTNITRIGSQSLTDIPTTDGHSSVTVLYNPNTGTTHAGFIVMPNGIAGGGEFCFIAGRNYRWTNSLLKSNIDVILRYYMGIQ